jgi:predicted transcriptional regulator
MKERVLHVHVGEPESTMRDRALAIAKALDTGQDVEPYVGIGFTLTEQMLSVFTPERWRLVGLLREVGPLTVAELARRLGRHYRNVHADCKRLEEWYVVEWDESGRVSVPWEEVQVDIHLPGQVAA